MRKLYMQVLRTPGNSTDFPVQRPAGAWLRNLFDGFRLISFVFTAVFDHLLSCDLFRSKDGTFFVAISTFRRSYSNTRDLFYC